MSTITAPDRMMRCQAALDHANAVKAARRLLLREMHARPVHESRACAASLLRNVPPELASMNVEAFLLRVRNSRGGLDAATLAARWLGAAEINSTRRVGELTDRQARALADAIR